MKNILRIPTVEPYGYVESEFEGSAEDAIAKQKRLHQLMKGGEGMERDDWNYCLDHYIKEHTMTADEYAAMSLPQQSMIQELKKSFKRTKE